MKTKAEPVLNEKVVLGEWTVQMVIWRLAAPVVGSDHLYKYRLYCGRNGQCRLRYDNERGKGDHIHDGENERPYWFTDYETLISDFRSDVRRVMEREQ
ncbi:MULTISPECIES: toxin-antitoxin system TumE family protein [Methylotuvimicrobium]|uniref:Uncharacterized protein n=2 Tax=Methylotuvimicrobium TaxID=2822410 RepID=G4SYN5_META2|nr:MULTISPECIES: DUF6516 family protein [Methylotuvimicrobium]CCE23221.1 conserved protein of unknown function [Methylotuvimicrobium alcaliphilum 20Z]